MKTNLKPKLISDRVILWMQLLMSLVGMLVTLRPIVPFRHIFDKIPVWQYSLTTALPTALLFFLLAYALHLKRKLLNIPNLNDYDFEEPDGFFIHHNNRTFHCSKCLHELGNGRSLLIFLSDKGLICSNCERLYSDATRYANLRGKYQPHGYLPDGE